MSETARRIYTFGPFRVDAVRRLLLRDDQTVPLTAKAFDILLVLLEEKGRVVEKDEIMRRVWPDAVVEETNLTVNMSALRKALGESPRERLYLLTVSGRGYQFVADVRYPDGEPTEGTEEKVPADGRAADTGIVAKPRGRNLKMPVALTLTALAGLVVAALFFWSLKATPDVKVKTFAVLPFKSLNNNEHDEALALGMADALITYLSNIRQINVRPTSAVIKYATSKSDPLAAGQELNVDAVLEGSVRRAGNRVRVTVQLVSVREQKPIWADSFEEHFTDIFTLQDSITAKVADALKLVLSDEDRRRLAKRYTENAEAYQHYLKGRYFWSKRSKEGFEKAVEYFRQAINIDPNYALAYSGLSDCYFLLASGPVPPREALSEARKAAAKALEIDESLAEAHTSLANARRLGDFDWAGAERELKRAIELNPDYAPAHQFYAITLSATGRHTEAIAEVRLALELEPTSAVMIKNVARILYEAHRYDEAITYYRQALEIDPSFSQAYREIGLAYEQKGMYDEAVTALQKALSLPGIYFSSTAQADLAHVYAVSGKRGDAFRLLNKLQELSKHSYVSPYDIAVVYAGLEDKEQALTWLYKAYEDRSRWMVWLKVDPRLDVLRSDSRFVELEGRMGLAQ